MGNLFLTTRQRVVKTYDSYANAAVYKYGIELCVCLYRTHTHIFVFTRLLSADWPQLVTVPDHREVPTETHLQTRVCVCVWMHSTIC